MDILQLATIGVLFLVSLLRQTHGCFSMHDCCNHSQIHSLGTHLKMSDPITSPSSTDSATACRASSDGTVAERSISPWSYKKDFSATRYPQNLWQASCSCDHCLSLKPPVQHNPRTYITLEANGNSVTVQHSMIVFYREHCPGKPGWFYLQPRSYVVNVSCACVVPTYSRKA
ncbi:interleukin-25 [Vipera latastei]